MAEQIARYKPGENVSIFASAAQILAGRFVKVNAAKSSYGDYVGIHCTATTPAFGVSQRDSEATTEDPSSQGRRVECVRRGAIARVVAGAAVAVGDLVQSDANGKAITVTSTNYVQGVALTASAADLDVIEVDLF